MFNETNDTVVFCAKNVNAFPLSPCCLSWRILPPLPPCARMREREREKGRYYCTILLPYVSTQCSVAYVQTGGRGRTAL